MTPNQRMPVMHVIDTLAAAGAERVAVNIVNHLPRDRYVPYLCTTRSDGPLGTLVAPDVIRLRLRRDSRFDYGAIKVFRKFIRANHIRILHVHSSSLFLARIAAMGLGVVIIWHAHYGRYVTSSEFVRRYRVGTFGIDGVITVSEDLAKWCSRQLGIPSVAVWYLPNPVSFDAETALIPADLPGTKGRRIVCLANFRPEKDHSTLLKAMARVVSEVPAAHLVLVGKDNDPAYKSQVEKQIGVLGLERHVSILGARHDVSAILAACDIGVLSSSYEGLPMSLLEYGAAGLAAVATRVGQCADVLDQGHAGILVPPASVGELSTELISLLESAGKRLKFAELFRRRVNETYSANVVVSQICKIYETLDRKERGCLENVSIRCDAPAI